jgi:hypothetical protein
LAGGILTGGVEIKTTSQSQLTINITDAPIDHQELVFKHDNSGQSIIGKINAAHNAWMGGIKFGADNVVHDLRTGGKFWHSGNDGAGSGLDADLLGGKASSASNTPNTHVTRDGLGSINVFSVNVDGTGIYNESGSLRITKPLLCSGKIRSDTVIEANGVGFYNNANYLYTPNAIWSEYEVKGHDIHANGGRHYGGSVRSPETCTLGADYGHRLGFFWESNYFAVCINNSINKGFDIWNYSDLRIKEHVKPTPVDALSVLRGLGVYAFDVKQEMAELLGEPLHHRVGMSADEVEEVIPEAVAVLSTTDWMDKRVPGDLKQLRYKEMIPWIVKALQQLADRVDALE